MESVTFEAGCRLEQLEEEVFSETAVMSIEIPASIVVFGKQCLCACKKAVLQYSELNDPIRRAALRSITFQSGSRLERIEDFALAAAGFQAIVIPASVVVIGRQSLANCQSLESVTLESGSRLERIEASAFWHDIHLKSFAIPASLVVLGRSAFEGCRHLKSVTIEDGSRLERIEESAFTGSSVKQKKIVQALGAVSLDAKAVIHKDAWGPISLIISYGLDSFERFMEKVPGFSSK
jgi:hypothetical protein